MISNQTLLNEIEKHVTNAKNFKNDEVLREHIIAIRALCDLALATKGTTPSLSIPQPVQSTFVERNQPAYTPPSSLTSTKLEEEGANGDSIFDF